MFKFVFFTLLFTSLAASYNAYKIILYSDFKSESLNLTADSKDLGKHNFSNKAVSAEVTGLWILYEGVKYNKNNPYGLFYGVWRNNQLVPSLKSMEHRAMSVRTVGDTENLRGVGIAFFTGPNFSGGESFYEKEKDGQIHDIGSPFKAGSLIMIGTASWQIKTASGKKFCLKSDSNTYPNIVAKPLFKELNGEKIVGLKTNCYARTAQVIHVDEEFGTN